MLGAKVQYLAFFFLVWSGSFPASAHTAQELEKNCGGDLALLYAKPVAVAAEMGLNNRSKVQALLTGPDRQKALDLIRTFENSHSSETEATLKKVLEQAMRSVSQMDDRDPWDALKEWANQKFFGRNPKHFIEQNRMKLIAEALDSTEQRVPMAIRDWWSHALGSLGHKPISFGVNLLFNNQMEKRREEFFKRYPLTANLRRRFGDDFMRSGIVKHEKEYLARSRKERLYLERELRRAANQHFNEQTLKRLINTELNLIREHQGARKMYYFSQSILHGDGYRAAHNLVKHHLENRKLNEPELTTYLANMLFYRAVGEPPFFATADQFIKRIRSTAVSELHELADKIIVEQPSETESARSAQATILKPEPRVQAKNKVKTKGAAAQVNEETEDKLPNRNVMDKFEVVFPIPNPNQITIFPRDKDLKHFFETGDARGAEWSTQAELLGEKLTVLAQCRSLEEIAQRFPRLKRYNKPEEAYFGYYAIRLNQKYRIVFHWEGKRAVNLVVDNYHYVGDGEFNLPPVK